MRLNMAQQKAARHFKGPCMVLAGPGSGKTLTIASRIKCLIKEYKVRPEEILVITFTRAASYEMQQRTKSIMDGAGYPVTFGTFHGVYYGILKWAYGLTSANILTEEEKYQMIRQILDSPDLEMDMDIQDEQDYIRDILSEISRVKNNGIDIHAWKSETCGESFGGVFKMYEAVRKKRRKIDFDDMLVLCLDLFRRRPDILEKWQKRFRFILVDEFQDVNRVQYEVLKLLAFPENNLFVVGDDDQSIYEFRGASPEIMLRFKEQYPDAEQILLDINYRSSSNILNGAMRVIEHNHSRYRKKIVTEKESGDCVHVQELKNAGEEGRYVIDEIRKLIKGGIAFSQIAVLYRTNIDARVLAGMMMEEKIPFRMKEYISNIYDHFIARNIKSYFYLILGRRDRRYFFDIMNCPKRYISRESLEKTEGSFEEMRRFYCDKDWMQDRIDQFEWDIQMMEQKTPFAAIRYIRKRIGYDEYLKEYAKSHRMNEEDLFEILSEIEEKAKEFRTIEEWFDYVEQYTMALKMQKEKEKKVQDAVSLMTMHGAKGLEFDAVFMIQSNEGIIPYKKAKMDEELEEERRMFYVGMTRARQKLVISYIKEKNGKAVEPSRFVSELLVRS